MARVQVRMVETFEYEVDLNDLPTEYDDPSSVEAVVQQDIQEIKDGTINAWDLSYEGPQIEEITFQIVESDTAFVD